MLEKRFRTATYAYALNDPADPSRDMLEQIQTQITEIVEKATKEAQIRSDQAHQEFTKTREKAIGTLSQTGMILIIGGAFLTGTAILASFLLTRILSRRLQEMENATKQYASGNLDFRLNPIHRDTVGKLGTGIDEMAKQLQRYTAELNSAKIRAEEAQKRAEQDRAIADEANRAKSEFLANMSHEIRTPMNGIMGMTELALGTELNKAQEEYLTTALDSANSLLAILNDILDLSKIEAGKVELESINFSIVHCVESATEILAHRARESDLELICTVSPNVPRVLLGDPTRLRQLIVNLGGNAIKFTRHGEVAISVDLEELDIETATILITVRDTGIGIRSERQKAIFDSFTQADGTMTRKYGGTGLGLAICKQIVELMAGQIWLESELGKGSSFFVRLVLPVGTDSEDAEPGNAPENIDYEVDLAKSRILVVDDNATNRRFLQITLNSWGCDPALASEGNTALELIREADLNQCPFDIVLLDVQMPTINGIEVERRIRFGNFEHKPKIIMLSSLGGRKELEKDSGAEMDSCMIKPIKQSVLKNTIISVLFPDRTREPVLNVELLQEDLRNIPARVLVVEDNLVNQKLTVIILEKIGCTVTVADNGLQALEKLEEELFDIILMDMQMPEMDGYEATSQIRADGRWSDLPIIALTAHAMEGDREKCFDAGTNDYISKPINAKTLHEKIKKWTTETRSIS